MKTAFDTAAYALGMTDDVKGTGVFNSFELHRDAAADGGGANSDGTANSKNEEAAVDGAKECEEAEGSDATKMSETEKFRHFAEAKAKESDQER